MDKNKNENRTDVLTLIAAIITFAMLLMLLTYQGSVIRKYEDIIRNFKGDTVTVTDTVFKTNSFTSKPKVIFKRDTIYKAKVKDDHADSMELNIVRNTFRDTLINDSDTITYEADVIGPSISEYSPRLDSITINHRNKVITNTNIITVYKEKPTKFTFKIRPAIIAGYDPFNKQFGLMAGVGFTY